MTDISVFAQTDVGKIRKGNEDSFLVADSTSEHVHSLSKVLTLNLNDKKNFFMVSDGMGGPAAGEVASLLAVNTVLNRMNFNAISTESEFVRKLVDLLENANSAIYEKARSNSKLQGMGTTATLSGIFSNKLFIGQIGDSRAYVLRKDNITQVTKDQSYVNQLVETGVISEEEAENHPRKNIILQALGTRPTIKVATTSVELCQNDYLILCSDGLSGEIKKEEIKETIKSSPDLTSACQSLIDLANQRGGPDNITVVIAHFISNNLSPSTNDKTVNYKVLSEFIFTTSQ